MHAFIKHKDNSIVVTFGHNCSPLLLNTVHIQRGWWGRAVAAAAAAVGKYMCITILEIQTTVTNIEHFVYKKPWLLHSAMSNLFVCIPLFRR